MTQPKIVSRAEWLEASRALLAEEKTWTAARDRLAEKRRALPWVKIEKRYLFADADGPVGLADLFDGRSQLVIYHFMFAPDWEEGCPGCSLLADQVDGARRHFEHNDVSFTAVSRAPLAKLQAYRWRMGWQFRWVSAANSDFNLDYHVAFPAGARERFYNFETRTDITMDDLPGVSVFHQDAAGTIYHTYSSYGRGGEMFLPVYSWLDIVPKGRNETQNGNMMDWVKRHDRYADDGRTQPAPRQKGAA